MSERTTKIIPTLSNISFPRELYLTRLKPGKIRERFETSGNDLLLVTTDRISAFDVVLGTIPHKGQVLNRMSQFWFEKTRDIIPNHMIAVPDLNVMVVKKTTPLPVEIVVRGYMKGVSGTSIWPMYERGERNMYGVHFREGYKYGDKLDEPIITPTTKAVSGHDKPITEKEIVKDGLVNAKVWKQTREAALALFKRGQRLAKKSGFLMIDTKIEFGLDENGKLLVIDELFTPDSAGFWLAKTYEKRRKKGLNPEIFDKEYLRIAYVDMGYKGEGSPPSMPPKLRDKVSKKYVKVFEKITGQKIQLKEEDLESRVIKNIERYLGKASAEVKTKSTSQQKVVIIMGSIKDDGHCKIITDELKRYKIDYDVHVCSAHKNTQKLLDLLETYKQTGAQIVYVTVAGRTDALSGVVAGNVISPVISCPPPSDKYAGLDILSSLRSPSYISNATVLEPKNVALAVARIIALSNPTLSNKLHDEQIRIQAFNIVS